MTSISATDFKARCLRLLDEVGEGGGELTITRHGKPVAKLVPAESDASLEGSVEFLVCEVELISPIGVTWEAEAD